MRLVVLALSLLPAVAHAAPVIAAVGAALSTAVIGTITVGQILFSVGMSVLGKAQQRRMAKKAQARARDEYDSKLQDQTLTGIATDFPRRFVYGISRVGSAIIAIFNTGDRDQYQHLVCVLASHEVDEITEIYINGKALGPLDADGYVTGGPFYKVTRHTAAYPVGSDIVVLPHDPVPGTVFPLLFPMGDQDPPKIISIDGRTVTFDTFAIGFISYQHDVVQKFVRVQIHRGVPNDPVDPYLHSLVPDKWPATSVLRGHAYLVVTLDLNEQEFQAGPPEIEAQLRGKPLYDFRTSTTAFSRNPVLAIYDYLTGPTCGVDPADLPMSQWIAAANVCDEVIRTTALGIQQTRYRIDGVITTDQPQQQVLEKMAQAMAGGIVTTTWDIYAGKYTAPVMALDQSDIVGNLAITPGGSNADICNGVRGQWFTGEVATDFKPYQNATYVAADGVEKWHDLDFPFTNGDTWIHDLCRIYVEDMRNGYTVNAEFSLKAWKLKVGQRVTLTSELFGWSAKVFRITDKKFSPTSGVELTLKEDVASIWDLADEVAVDSTPNSNLPNPFKIDPPASLTCASGTDVLQLNSDGTLVSRIKLSWPEVSTGSIRTSGLIEYEWQMAGEAWQRLSTAGDRTEGFTGPVKDGAWYLARARCFDPLLNVRSSWTYAEPHQVIGKTEPPPDITDLSISGSVLSWSPVVAVDLKGYVFRFHYGNNRDWGTAAPLHEGVITSSPFDLTARPGGVVTIMGKAIDWSGNYSNAAAAVVLNLGDPPIANVVEEFNFHADGFPGTIQNGTVDGIGDLIAAETDSAYGSDSQSFYGADNDPAFDLSSYAELVYTTSEIQISGALAGSVMTVEHNVEGIDLVIQYRLAGPGSAYGIDSDSAYGPDADPFYDAPGGWTAWPGQIIAANDIYQFRVTVGTGPTRARIAGLRLVIDAPDIVEYLEDVPIDAAGTVVPFTKNFAVIKTVTHSLQANASGAETIEVDKTANLAPVLRAYNASHTAVSGATADIIVKGY